MPPVDGFSSGLDMPMAALSMEVWFPADYQVNFTTSLRQAQISDCLLIEEQVKKHSTNSCLTKSV